MQNHILKIDINEDLPKFSSICAHCLRSSSEPLLKDLCQIGNRLPYVIISACVGEQPNQVTLDANIALLKDIKSRGFLSFQLIGKYIPGRISYGQDQVLPITEVLFMVCFEGQVSLRDFIHTFMDLSSSHGIKSFMLGLPEDYDYEKCSVNIDALSPGHHYFISPSNGPTVLTQQFNINAVTRYQAMAYRDRSSAEVDWRWLGVVSPTSWISAMGHSSVGLRWHLPKC
ncbi:MAG: hypothetical protein NTY08_12745 [Proteobacteria bacterium]|nr:hypothetical protein [Pseudomonadota bacterium]